MKSNYKKGLVSIIISAFCFAAIGTLGVLLFNGGAGPLTLLAGRFAIASLMLFLTLLVWDKKLFIVKREDIKWFLLSGLILFVHLLSFWYGFNIVRSVSIQYALFFLYPIWTAILSSVFQKDKISKVIPLCLLIGVIGILLTLGIIPNGVSFVPLAGVVFGVLTSILWSLYYFSNQYLVNKYNSFTVLFYNFLFVFLLCLFVQPIYITISQITFQTIWYLLALGFISTFMSYLFLHFALRFNGSVLSSIQNMVLPFLGSLLAFLVLKQTMTIYQILGGGLIIFNIYLLNRWSK